MTTSSPYPIGTPGQPWGAPEKAAWLARQTVRRTYAADVLSAIDRLRDRFDVSLYGRLDHDPDRFPLYAVRSRDWSADRPCVLITGGVHGYETSGVHGALCFLERHAADYAGRVDLLVAPCVSPWAYETVQRWNPQAVDPNRSFFEPARAQEAGALMALVAPVRGRVLMHMDLHETTDTDESEFRPAKAARDGTTSEPDEIPDGFYLVADTERPQPEFHQAVMDAVEKVTHIAPADRDGRIIGSPIVAPGVIRYPVRGLGLCAGITEAPYCTTTEVYPDSARTNPEECILAQVAAVRAGIDYALTHPVPQRG